jgi:hypothetical protein
MTSAGLAAGPFAAAGLVEGTGMTDAVDLATDFGEGLPEDAAEEPVAVVAEVAGRGWAPALSSFDLTDAGETLRSERRAEVSLAIDQQSSESAHRDQMRELKYL